MSTAFDTLDQRGLKMLATGDTLGPLPLIVTAARKLDTACWADCRICSLDVNACECDPDDYASALLGRPL